MGILFSYLSLKYNSNVEPEVEHEVEHEVEPEVEHEVEPEVESDQESEISLTKRKSIFTLKSSKKALLIGINYQNDDSSGNDLNGCVDDAERLKTYLTKTCYFNEEDITMLCTHDSTTKNSIQKQLRELVFFSYSNPNSELWFSFSGHGSGFYSKEEHDDQSECICPSDYKQNGMIIDYWLKDHFIDRLHPSTKLFILMDCCHSGTNVNLPYQLINQKETLISNPNTSLLATVVKLSGCRDDQTSMEYYDNKTSEYQGALTTYFLANANEYRGTMFKVICDNVRKDLENKGFQQKPMLSFTKIGDSSWYLV